MEPKELTDAEVEALLSVEVTEPTYEELREALWRAEIRLVCLRADLQKLAERG